MARQSSIDPDALVRPPAEVLDAVAREDMRGMLRQLGVPRNQTADVVQDVVTTAYLKLHRGGAALPVPGEHDARLSGVRAFLAGILRRRASNARRRVHQRREVPAGLAADLPASMDDAACDPTPEQRAASAERLAVLLGILAEMPPEYAEVLVLHAVHELTLSEIAERLGVNENTAKSRLSRARTHAREAARNLPADKRRLLEGSPLGALFLWRASEESAPESRQPRTVAAALVTLIAGLGFAAGPHAASRRAPEATVIAIAEHVPGGAPAMTAAEPASALLVPSAAPVAALQASPAAPRAAVQAIEHDTLPAEKVWIEAARRALGAGTYSRVLVNLAIHEQRYPHGKLAGVREELRAEVRARWQARIRRPD